MLEGPSQSRQKRLAIFYFTATEVPIGELIAVLKT